METSNPAKSNDSEHPTGPGHVLQQARKDLRLAPEDVAQILHLSAKQIIALEKDDYQNLPGATYIRGYLRNYAQLLGLSPEKVIESYNKLAIPSNPISQRMSMPTPQMTSENHLVKAATVGLVFIVFGLVYLWWRTDGPSFERSISLTSPDSRESTTVPSSNADRSKHVPALLPGSETPSRTASTPTTSIGQSIEPSSDPVKQTNLVKTLSSDNRTTGPVHSTDIPPNDSSRTTASSPSDVTDRAISRSRRVEDIPPGVIRSRLVLRVNEESWADIRDARDNKLLYENIPAGRNISIEGVAPFMIFLGNADGVRVEFNGQHFDFSRYRRGRVARFTVGEKAAVN